MAEAAEETETVVGYSHLDEKGRVVLSKPIREALGLTAGAVIASVKVGGGVLLVPLDAHLAQVMDAAARVLEHAHLNVALVMATLPEIRDEVTSAHYGPEFLRSLGSASGEQLTLGDDH